MKHHPRNKAIFIAVLQGETFTAAGARYGISMNRTRQVFQEVRRILSRPLMLGDDVIPQHNFYDNAEVRKHADFWLRQVEKWNPLQCPGPDTPPHIPQPRTETVTVTYWTCGIESHRHKSSTLAQRCIAARARVKRSDKPLTLEEQKQAYSLLERGLYPVEIARIMGKTVETVRAVILPSCRGAKSP